MTFHKVGNSTYYSTENKVMWRAQVALSILTTVTVQGGNSLDFRAVLHTSQARYRWLIHWGVTLDVSHNGYYY